MRIGWFDVKVQLIGNKLTAEITLEDFEADNVSFYFYLIKEGKTLDKQGWFTKNTYSWELKDSGMYCVQGYVKSGNEKLFRRSAAIGYFDVDANKTFDDFMNSERSEVLPYQKPLKFFYAKEPFADFIIVSQKSKLFRKYDVSRFVEENSKFEHVKHSKIGKYDVHVLSTSEERILANGDTVFFSGITTYEDKLIFGAKEITDNIETNKLLYGYGNNSEIIIRQNEILLGTDFFNFSRWFYYERDDLFVASNRYHSLLLMLKSLDISLLLDERKAAITLSTVSVQFLTQNFTRAMDVESVFQLENDKSLRINKTGWIKEDSEYGRILQNQQELTKDEYKKLLVQAKNEILSQVGAALNDDRFEHIMLDLTGGLDSRMIYAAATNYNRDVLKKKVRVVSNHVAGSQDLPIATKINGIYGLEYDNLPQVHKMLSIKEADQMMRSFYMGTYFSSNPFQFALKDYNNLSLNGACGEILARPYIARKYFGTLIDDNRDVKKVANYIWGDFAANIIAADLDSAHDFERYISTELMQIPVSNILEAYDRIYLQFRHGYHFDQVLNYAMGRMIWMPMQSKTAFVLHHLTFSKYKNIKLELDLIAQLNPMLLSIEFDSDQDNADYRMVEHDLMVEDERFFAIHTDGKEDMKRWEIARRQRNESTQYLYDDSEDKSIIQEQYKRKQELLYSALLRNFHELMLYCSMLRKRLGVALYYYITSQKDNPKTTQYMYNKISSLLDQVKLIKE